MDFERLAAELVRARRGNRTQKALSRRLGYKSNVLFAWENRHQAPSARAFFRMARQTGATRQTGELTAPSDLTARAGIAELLRSLAGETSIAELARRLDRDRYAVSRWLRGKTEISLADLLRFVEVTTLRLFDFLEDFADPSKLPSVAADYERFLRARRAAIEMPWAHAIVHMADLPSYRALSRHEPGWFASRLGVSSSDEAICLQHLVESGQLLEKEGRYRRAPAMTIDTRPDPKGTRQLASFWLQEGARRVLEPGSGRFSFNTFAVSRSDLDEIHRLQGEYFRQLRAIVDQSEPTEAVAVATFQLLPLAVEDGA